MNIQLRVLRSPTCNEFNGYKDTLQQRERIGNPLSGRNIVGWTDWENVEIVFKDLRSQSAWEVAAGDLITSVDDGLLARIKNQNERLITVEVLIVDIKNHSETSPKILGIIENS